MTKIVDNFDQVINDIKRKLSDDGVKRRTLAYIANAEIARIKDRTQNKGKDFKGNPFIPYSKKYTRAKIKESGHVDLTDTGQMFSSLTYRLANKSANLFFSQGFQNRKAYYHDVAGVGKKKVKRPFFRLSDKEKDVMSNLFAKEYFKNIKLNIK
tara:strand:- start:204 stop:665 length:462 start_codon:yes stop_codon:yes gene_type:complete